MQLYLFFRIPADSIPPTGHNVARPNPFEHTWKIKNILLRQWPLPIGSSFLVVVKPLGIDPHRIFLYVKYFLDIR